MRFPCRAGSGVKRGDGRPCDVHVRRRVRTDRCGRNQRSLLLALFLSLQPLPRNTPSPPAPRFVPLTFCGISLNVIPFSTTNVSLPSSQASQPPGNSAAVPASTEHRCPTSGNAEISAILRCYLEISPEWAVDSLIFPRSTLRHHPSTAYVNTGNLLSGYGTCRSPGSPH